MFDENEKSLKMFRVAITLLLLFCGPLTLLLYSVFGSFNALALRMHENINVVFSATMWFMIVSQIIAIRKTNKIVYGYSIDNEYLRKCLRKGYTLMLVDTNIINMVTNVLTLVLIVSILLYGFSNVLYGLFFVCLVNNIIQVGVSMTAALRIDGKLKREELLNV